MTRSWLSYRAGIACALLLSFALAACGGGSAVPSSPVTPIPTPVPTATPDPNVPPAGSGCGQPYPPTITRIPVKVHLKDQDYWTLDTTPLVGPDGAYCAAIGFTDGRLFCPIRPEGAPDRAACEDWRIGIAKDTGQPGPNWTFTPPGGTPIYCTGPASGCEHNENPYQMRAYKGGLYRVCTSDPFICDEVNVERGL